MPSATLYEQGAKLQILFQYASPHLGSASRAAHHFMQDPLHVEAGLPTDRTAPASRPSLIPLPAIDTRLFPLYSGSKSLEAHRELSGFIYFFSPWRR